MAKPIVNGIEKDLQGRATVVRVNMLSKLGREIARCYDVKAVPTTLVFDNGGDVSYRHAGLPNRHEVVEQVSRPR